ncbi:hypothetical protein [Clostridium manihotivorum]|uniref:Uncharacterized protein n=1 Tax=Clostridium manihotivorum TaxID=2320868 RepID=A0A410DWS8_9CLOT|nr:hypothetical protein [Clostridium manihotivorum]QAA33490.1 hypothetical protein C1I91_18570 [Clostridium manihotivorum]
MEVYNSALDIIATHEIITQKGKMVTVDDHYGALNNIAPKSIPEIVRQFESTFPSGSLFYKNCIAHLNQPSYHLRKIIKLKELYDNDSLESLLRYCIEENIYNINDIKNILKTKYLDIVKGISAKDELLTLSETSRELSYYEEGQF